MEHIAERYSTVVKETNKKLPLYGPQKVWQKALPAVRALHTYNIFISFRVFIIVLSTVYACTAGSKES